MKRTLIIGATSNPSRYAYLAAQKLRQYGHPILLIGRRTKNYKLTESKVRIIKKLLKNDNNRLKMIAKQFGITHTQLNRIRSGENWKHVTIED